MNIFDTLHLAVQQQLQALFQLTDSSIRLPIQVTNPEHSGDLTIVVFPLAKYKLGAPDAVAQQLGEALLTALPHELEGFNVIKGFLNLTLRHQYWIQFLGQVLNPPTPLLSKEGSGGGLTPFKGEAGGGLTPFKGEAGDGFTPLLSKEGAGGGLTPSKAEEVKGQKVMIEFPSPNTNKPLHLGHLRNIFLGESLARILTQAGFTVIRACLYNDKGIHICKSMLAYLRQGQGQTPESMGLKGDHFVGHFYVVFNQMLEAEAQQLVEQGMDKEAAKLQAPVLLAAQDLYRQWEQGEPSVIALWKQMNEWVYAGFNETFAELGVHFDKSYYESQTYELGRDFVRDGVEKGLFYRKPDGSTWVDLTAQKLDEKVLLRSDGTSVYITQDIGTAELKYADFQIDRSIYVIGNEQDYHMKVLIELLKKLERPYANGVYHLSYGMVELPTGKMKSREGTVVDADDLIAELKAIAQQKTEELGKADALNEDERQALYAALGLGAVKYYLLRVDPAKKLLFNPEESIDFKGHTGVFIQYIHARTRSVLRKAAQEGLAPPYALDAALELSAYELDVVKLIHHYSHVLAEAAQSYSPALVANYVYELAKSYSRFYYEVPILQAETAAQVQFRLALSLATAETIAVCLHMLGIDAPHRM